MKVRFSITTLVVMAAMSSIAVARIGAARTFDLATASIADINDAFHAGALTSERLTRLYLARIAAYDTAGPKLNAVLRINPKAEEHARALDVERRTKGSRGLLHGIPVLLKANIDVAGGRPRPAFMPCASRWLSSTPSRPRAFAVPDA
jgi:Asp-tRNA(Asn)/Glu-tRNA(Gln) amidotransferase A subunit family amidase